MYSAVARNQPDEHGDLHGSGQAFARDVAEYDEEPVVGRGHNLKKVATNLLGRLVNRFDDKAGVGIAGARHEDFLHLARSGHFTLQKRHLLTRLAVALALSDRDKDEARIPQRHGRDRGHCIECQTPLQLLHLRGLRELRPIRKPVRDPLVHPKLQKEDRNHRHPEFLAKTDSSCRVAYRKQTGKKDNQYEPGVRLAPHVQDVIGKADDCEHKENGQQKSSDRFAGHASPWVNGVHHVQGLVNHIHEASRGRS